MASLKSIALLALASGFATVANAQASGSGTTTRYWDCCKGSCGWTDKAPVSNPVTSCDIHDQPLTDYSASNGCDSGGSAYMCSDQSPFVDPDDPTIAYGFAAVSIAGGSESSWCCACYELTFTSTSLAGSGKKMIVQATNTGGDLSSNQFDLAMPGGGVGIFNGCTAEWGAPSSGWGAQYGGISSNDSCSSFPTALQPGCEFRFGDWFEGADNPTVDFTQVSCPAALTAKTGCVRDDDSGASSPSASPSAYSSSATAASPTAYSSSSSSPAAYSAPVASSSSVAAPDSASSSPAAYSAPSSSSSSSSSSVAAPQSASSSPAAYSTPSYPSSSVAAPVASSTSAAEEVSTTSLSTSSISNYASASSSSEAVSSYSPASSASASSSVEAPVSASSYAASSYSAPPSYGSSLSYVVAPVSASSYSAPASIASAVGGNADCGVQYTTVYDL